jgi:hypothetical protein
MFFFEICGVCDKSRFYFKTASRSVFRAVNKPTHVSYNAAQ